MGTKIAWTEETWNPVVGCTKVSPGCLNCYAEKMAARLTCMNVEPYHLTVTEMPQSMADNKWKYEWTGDTVCREDQLDKPLRWRNPRKIFVCSMGDLFHESVPFEFIDKAMKTIMICRRHTFQVLTKRPERMLEYAKRGLKVDENEKYEMWTKFDSPFFSNLWLGVSIENPDYKHRADTLRQIPAAVRFLSLEPLLGDMGKLNLEGINWVIIGAESKGAYPGRYCNLDWIRKIVYQCRDAKVPCFVKQIISAKKPYGIKLEKDSARIKRLGYPQQYPKGETK